MERTLTDQKLQVVVDDPYLEPYENDIRLRRNRFNEYELLFRANLNAGGWIHSKVKEAY